MEVQIRNKELLEYLDNFIETFFAIPGYDSPEFNLMDGKDPKINGELYCSDEYLFKHIALGDKHKGFPEEHYSSPLMVMVEKNPELYEDLAKSIRTEFTKILGCHSVALSNYYPPGGFVGWHTNWNANAYQVLFTWSRTGDGYFRYYDMNKKKIITEKDKPGWQCRYYYFGREDEPEHHCWHAAYAGCDRFTLAYKFVNERLGSPTDKIAKSMRDQLIEEIEEE